MSHVDKNVAWIGDSASQQIQEQSAKYSGGAEMSGYAALTRLATSALPKGWVVARIGDLAAKAAQRTPADDDEFIYVDIGSIDRNLKIISAPQKLLGKDAPSRARKVINTGDVLVSLTRPNLNAVALVGQELDNQIASTGFEVIKPITVDSRYIFALVRSEPFIDSISGKVQGALYPAAKSDDVRGYEFLLPSLAEQQQIAAKLDELLAQVDSIKTRLDAIPKTLKRFRQSVLAAAVSGKLTEGWRKMGNHLWINATLKEVFKCIDGDRGPNYPKKDEYKKEGYCLFLSTKNVREFGFDFTDQVFLEKEKHEVLRNGTLARGDLVITTRGTLGYVASYDDSVPFDVVRVNSGMLILRKLNSDYKNEFFKIVIASPLFQKQINDKRTGSAQPQLPANILKDFLFEVPPIKEQTEIVRRVEQLFAYADQIEQRVKDAQARVNHLTQAIIAKAFRGELTADWRAQNPELISGENSAEALLQRIKIERESGGAGRKSKTV